MRISDFDYVLPADRIAQVPAEPRDSSRLLVLDPSTGAIEHRRFYELTGLLEAGDLLVVNDTRVTARRLLGQKSTGGSVEALLLREVSRGTWEALVRPGKRIKPGSELHFEEGLTATVVGETAFGGRVLCFDNPEKAAGAGSVPLPPYIHAALESDDRYQTVFSNTPGSAAAPTAGLHFTVGLMEALTAKGVEIASVTLDVSIDTFRPVQAEDPADHKMHGERYSISERTATAISRCKGRVLAVGTTTVRALESAAIGHRQVQFGESVTDFFITPGFEFKAIDGMITNFHMPRTTMLLLVSALCGIDNLRNAYATALESDYRFLSFGDAMLILPRSNE
jgi:S-adenosylmethionine:tRNA ribosyltransferase-isomerase